MKNSNGVVPKPNTRSFVSKLGQHIIERSEDRYTIFIVIPGYAKQDVNMDIQANSLTVKAERKSDDRKYRQREFVTNGIERNFHLSDDIDQEKIHAHLENGVLEIVLPKKEKSKPIVKNININ